MERISCRIALEDAIDTAYLRMLTQIDINVRAEPSASAYISAFRLVDYLSSWFRGEMGASGLAVRVPC